MSETGWLEITTINDTERQFVSVDGKSYRSEPFEDVTYSGDWRAEFGHVFRQAGSDAGLIPVVISAVAVVVALMACILQILK